MIIKVVSAVLLLSQMLSLSSGRASIFDISSFFNLPQVRDGRTSIRSAMPLNDYKNGRQLVSVSKDGGEEAAVIAKLIDEVMRSGLSPRSVEQEEFIPVEVKEDPSSPRNVEEMRDFGSRLEDVDDPIMDLERDIQERQQQALQRQNDAADDDNEIRCIPKLMQIEETVYDRGVKCHHSYEEKCHMTYITDYKTVTEQKCETTYDKNCHIVFKPTPFNETVKICNTPLVRQCSEENQGPDICNTYYETNCETVYKSYEVDQDEPDCRMEIEKKCENVTLELNGGEARQLGGGDETTTANPGESTTSPGTVIVVDEKCEEWPVQKCTLNTRKVTKVHPDTACRKIPREVCVPNNCAMVQGDEVCREENRMQVQNIPQEECDLNPVDTCHMEAVLVPRLVPKPNCIKVPKEICVNSRNNPRVVKKPIIKEWCYRPSDLQATGETIPTDASSFRRAHHY